jgi:hypothetical protein
MPSKKGTKTTAAAAEAAKAKAAKSKALFEGRDNEMSCAGERLRSFAGNWPFDEEDAEDDSETTCTPHKMAQVRVDK